MNYLENYGISQKCGDLLYKKLLSGRYLVTWQSCRDVDVYLCRWLPKSHEELNDKCIIDRIHSFDDTDVDKVAKFKQMLQK